jgi:death-on-curing protein
VTVWLSHQTVLAIHEEQLAEHGGAVGLRDGALLESALARPVNHAGYGQPDIAELAALHAIAIVRNHPFVDGNKRTACVMLETFLELNGVALDVGDADAVIAMLDLAAGVTSDKAFIGWVREHVRLP